MQIWDLENFANFCKKLDLLDLSDLRYWYLRGYSVPRYRQYRPVPAESTKKYRKYALKNKKKSGNPKKSQHRRIATARRGTARSAMPGVAYARGMHTTQYATTSHTQTRPYVPYSSTPVCIPLFPAPAIATCNSHQYPYPICRICNIIPSVPDRCFED